ncbi:Gamma-tubulin complex component 4 like protein [Cucumispora dikerogammari]|nr:Gamma-tubulin complex component 4 like protein [Cucumispora dikerogammari]
MQRILTELMESMKLKPTPKFIKYLTIITSINPRKEAKNIALLKTNILEIIKEEKMNLNEKDFFNLNETDLILSYILIKYKSITRMRNYKLENYTYLFNSNTFSKIFHVSNNKKNEFTNKSLITQEINKMHEFVQKKLVNKEINKNESVNALEEYYIILIKNLKIIKQYLELIGSKKKTKDLKFWIITILDEIEDDLFEILNSKIILFDKIYAINFLIEVLFEILKITETKININLYKNLLKSNTAPFHSEIFKKLNVQILMAFFINLLNENATSFVLEGKQIENNDFFLIENVSLEKDKEIINEIQIINELVPFFLKENYVHKLMRISKKTRYLNISLSAAEFGCLFKLKEFQEKEIFFIEKNEMKINKKLLFDFEKELDALIQENLVISLENYLLFLKDIFLNGRNDFLTDFIKKISEMERKSEEKSNFCKRSVTFLLSESIKNIFNNKRASYEKDLDILLEGGLQIILKPQYPFNLFFSSQTTQILTKILEFYMKLKRVELMLFSLKTRCKNSKDSNYKKIIIIHKSINLINNISIFMHIKFEIWKGSTFDIFESKHNLPETEELTKAYKESKIKYFNKLIKGIEIFCISGDETHLIFSIHEMINENKDISFLKNVLIKFIS